MFTIGIKHGKPGIPQIPERPIWKWAYNFYSIDIMKKKHLTTWSRNALAGAALVVSGLALAQEKPVYMDESKPVEERIQDALSRMTLEEKVAMCHGQATFSSPGVPRLGITELWMNDGPHGMRAETNWHNFGRAGWTNDKCTAFPALTCLAATFNPDMSVLYGKSIGAETRYRKKDVLLGPGVNIYRTPLNGRNFEYMGEDPFLSSVLVVPYIREAQKFGIAACVKHYALNNQETHRSGIDVQVSDRALNEIYLPAFKAAVTKGGAWAIMGAYNRFRGDYCCENDLFLNKILKGDWKFDGVVISDWGATHNTKEAAENGLDIEMGTSTDPNKNFMGTPMLEAVRKGEIKESVVDDKVRRILRLAYRTALNPNRPWGSFATDEHADASREIAEEGIVLLKNDGHLLPADPGKVGKIVVVGENAVRKMTEGGGSSELKVKEEISPLDGIKTAFPKSQVDYVPGYASNGKDTEKLRNDAVKAVAEADVVFFFGGLNKNGGQDSEGADRRGYALPYYQNELIEALVAANPKTAVILISGNAVETPWIDQVPALVQGWYGGSQAGNALANILSGKVNPSGKLPMSFPVKLTDIGAHSYDELCYPGKDGKEEYKEDILVGYRWLDTKKISPRFPFGHGLSYTTFKIDGLKTDKDAYGVDEPVKVTCKVTNTGAVPGAEVVQLYVHDEESSVLRPEKELKGFCKVFLKPGESREVIMELGKDAFSYYDDKEKTWMLEGGRFELILGNSSRDASSVRKSIQVGR